jgi:CRP/FNR family transcriptional regulator, cyclic AMP receptor protein
MIETLESIPLFQSLNRKTLRLLEPLFERYSYPAGEKIFEQGDPAVHIYLILEGSVEVHYKPYDGPSIVVTTLSKGSIFGWSAAIGNINYTSGAVCKGECISIRIRGNELHKFCSQHPEAGLHVLELLADAVSTRWTNAREQIHSLLSTSVNRGTIPAPGKEKR